MGPPGEQAHHVHENDEVPAMISAFDASDDEAVLEAIRAGDKAALAAAYDAHATTLYTFALGCGGEEPAAEIVQSVFLQLWRDPSRFPGAGGDLGAFLMSDARRLAVQHLRRADVGRAPSVHALRHADA